MGNGRVVSLNPLNGYLYADIQGKGLNKLNLKEIEFDEEEAHMLKQTSTPEDIEHKVLEEDYQEKP